MTVLAWVAAYLAVSVVVGTLLAAAIRHGERQHRAEMARLVRAHTARINNHQP